MPSSALGALVVAVQEVDELLRAASGGNLAALARLRRARVVGRASVVLLSSHFERYFYAVNEEACGYLNAASVAGDRLPEILRLVHSRPSIEDLAATAWERRAVGLAGLMQSES